MGFIAIGDIHGSLTQLSALLAEDALFDGRVPVFMGDYVDVGPRSKAVLERLISFKAQRPHSIFLLGNHEHQMLKYYDGGEFRTYAKGGGMPTIRSYTGEVYGDVHRAFADAVPSKHVEFLRSLAVYHETRSYLFSHCGYSPEHPDDRSLAAMVLESHQGLFDVSPSGPKVAVCGHYFQRTHIPFISDAVVCLDTGCGILNGPLTACLLPERHLIRIGADLSVTVTKHPDVSSGKWEDELSNR